MRDAQVAEESLRRSRKNCQELALERDQLKRQLLDSAQRENYVTSQLLESHAAFRQLHEANQLNLSLKLDKDKLTTQLNQLTVRLEAQRGLEDANTALQNEILSLKALLERRAELGGDGIEGQQRVEGGTARLTSDEGGAPRREDITPGTTRSGMQQEIINNEEKITRNATEEKGRGQETPQVGQVQTAGPNNMVDDATLQISQQVTMTHSHPPPASTSQQIQECLLILPLCIPHHLPNSPHRPLFLLSNPPWSCATAEWRAQGALLCALAPLLLFGATLLLLYRGG